MRQSVHSNLIFLSVGVIFIILGTCLFFLWPSLFKILLAKEFIISEKSKSFSEWKNPSVELFFDVYLFNWTNAEEFVFPDFNKPIFQQIGPFRFLEIRDKTSLKFNENNSTVSYKPFNTYFFDQEGSNASLDDIITNINMVAIGAAAQSLNMDYKKRKVVSIALNGYEEKITISKTAQELLFEGYEDNMVLMGKENLIEGFDISHIPYDKIGWFYLRNASSELNGIHNVHTGKDDISKLGMIQNYNGIDFRQKYTGECSKVYGSTGELFPIDYKANSLSIFAPDMCRSLPFDFEKVVDMNGIKGFRYLAGKRLIDNGTEYPENLCYSEGNDENIPSGVFNISACRFSSPVFMSYPHFYEADQYYLDQIEGLEPDKQNHESYITIEPMTGVPLEVAMRFQVNFQLKEFEDIALFQSCPKIFIPAIWVEQKFKINETMIDQLKIVYQIHNIGKMIGLIILGLGLLCIITVTVIKCISKNTTKNNDLNLPEMISTNRKPKETSPPLLNDENLKKKIVIQKMDQ